jgi:hypothetical protein
LKLPQEFAAAQAVRWGEIIRNGAHLVCPA